jgi:hypothetical protein
MNKNYAALIEDIYSGKMLDELAKDQALEGSALV